MAIFLFSLTGLPPLAGFVGKFFLFAAVIKEHFYLLALVAIINSVISLYYYARIVRTMFLDHPTSDDREVALTPINSALLGVLSALTLIFGVYWGALFEYTQLSLNFFIK